MLTTQLEQDQKSLETRKTVIDMVILKTITEVLSDNVNNRLTVATIHGLSAQINQRLCAEIKVNVIPQDIIERIRSLEQEVVDLNDALEQATAPTQVE